jgi:hypothetical protein
MPLAGRDRPCTWTIDADARAAVSASSRDNVDQAVDVPALMISPLCE